MRARLTWHVSRRGCVAASSVRPPAKNFKASTKTENVLLPGWTIALRAHLAPPQSEKTSTYDLPTTK